MTTTMTKHEDRATDMTESTANVERGRMPETRDEGRYLIPPVDIVESANDLKVIVDLPGVRREDIDVRVEDDVLTIEGRPSYRRPENLTYGEFDLSRFHRQFRLTDRVNPDRISAELKHGVLRVTLPKAERLQPRSIDVKIG